MLQKIEERLNKEVEKVLAKEELSIPDYLFLESQALRLKTEKQSKETMTRTDDLFTNMLNVFKQPEKKEECQCNKETLQA